MIRPETRALIESTNATLQALGMQAEVMALHHALASDSEENVLRAMHKALKALRRLFIRKLVECDNLIEELEKL